MNFIIRLSLRGRRYPVTLSNTKSSRWQVLAERETAYMYTVLASPWLSFAIAAQAVNI